MVEDAFLVQRGELDGALEQLVDKQRAVIADLDRCLPLVDGAELKSKLAKQKLLAEQRLRALEAGYVPVEGRWFWDIDVKTKWAAGQVRRMLESLPVEVRTAIEEVRESGVFQKVKVTAGRARGDPMLVGVAGGVNFLLAIWAIVEGGYSVGFVMRPRTLPRG